MNQARFPVELLSKIGSELLHVVEIQLGFAYLKIIAQRFNHGGVIVSIVKIQWTGSTIFNLSDEQRLQLDSM
jgi:hypothetical protein